MKPKSYRLVQNTRAAEAAATIQKSNQENHSMEAV